MSSQTRKLVSLLRVGCLSAVLWASLCVDAQASVSLGTTTLENVSIGSNTYDVTFWQSSEGLTSFNDVFGTTGKPVLTFHSESEAAAAATAIRSVAEKIGFDYTVMSNGPNAFTVAFAYTDQDFSFLSGWSDARFPFFSTSTPQTDSRDRLFGTAFVTFEKEQSVPEAPGIALIGLGLAAIGFLHRRRN